MPGVGHGGDHGRASSGIGFTDRYQSGPVLAIRTVRPTIRCRRALPVGSVGATGDRPGADVPAPPAGGRGRRGRGVGRGGQRRAGTRTGPRVEPDAPAGAHRPLLDHVDRRPRRRVARQSGGTSVSGRFHVVAAGRAGRDRTWRPDAPHHRPLPGDRCDRCARTGRPGRSPWWCSPAGTTSTPRPTPPCSRLGGSGVRGRRPGVPLHHAHRLRGPRRGRHRPPPRRPQLRHLLAAGRRGRRPGHHRGHGSRRPVGPRRAALRNGRPPFHRRDRPLRRGRRDAWPPWPTPAAPTTASTPPSSFREPSRRFRRVLLLHAAAAAPRGAGHRRRHQPPRLQRPALQPRHRRPSTTSRWRGQTHKSPYLRGRSAARHRRAGDHRLPRRGPPRLRFRSGRHGRRRERPGLLDPVRRTRSRPACRPAPELPGS